MTSQTTENNVNPIKIAVLAMGGQGGGVLADYARRSGHPVFLVAT